jgi:signal peptidase II
MTEDPARPAAGPPPAAATNGGAPPGGRIPAVPGAGAVGGRGGGGGAIPPPPRDDSPAKGGGALSGGPGRGGGAIPPHPGGGPGGGGEPEPPDLPPARQPSAAAGRVLFVLLAVLAFVVDRVSKGLVVGSLPLGSEVQVLPFLWIAHTRNTGAAFSIGPNLTLIFLVASAVISVGLVIYAIRVRLGAFTGAMLGLILGGAVGNGYDRLVHGGATDMIDLRWWPIFNLADSAITIGVAALILGYLLRHRNDSSA